MSRRKTVAVVLGALVLGLAVSPQSFGDAEVIDIVGYAESTAEGYVGLVSEYVYMFLHPHGIADLKAFGIADGHDIYDEGDSQEACDNNSNGILDRTEFMMLEAVFADAGHPHHEALHEAYKKNVQQLGGPRPGMPPTDSGDLGGLASSLAPDLKYIYAAYAVLGDGDYGRVVAETFGTEVNVGFGFYGSWGTVAETIAGMADYASAWPDMAPDDANYDRQAALASACGDLDGDGELNIAEFYGQLEDETNYLAAVDNAGTAVGGTYPAEVCEEPPPSESSPMATDTGLYWYNPVSQSVYAVNLAALSYTAAEAAAQDHTIGGDPMPGHLAGVKSEEETQFIIDTIMALADETMHIGLHDKTVEGDWEWLDDPGVIIWRGLGSGAGGVALDGHYTNWNGAGEPNDSGGEDECEIRGLDGNWNDNGGETRFSIVEFAGPL